MRVVWTIEKLCWFLRINLIPSETVLYVINKLQSCNSFKYCKYCVYVERSENTNNTFWDSNRWLEMPSSRFRMSAHSKDGHIARKWVQCFNNKPIYYQIYNSTNIRLNLNQYLQPHPLNGRTLVMQYTNQPYRNTGRKTNSCSPQNHQLTHSRTDYHQMHSLNVTGLANSHPTRQTPHPLYLVCSSVLFGLLRGERMLIVNISCVHA